MNRRQMLIGAGAAAAAGSGATWLTVSGMGSSSDYAAAIAPLRAPLPDPARFSDLIRYATLAPNGHNTQPWRFRVGARRMPHTAALMRGELMRYLAEIAWAPDAILQNTALRWREGGAHDIIVGAGEGASAVEISLGLDSAGRIATAFAPDRPRSAIDPILPTPWRSRFSDYRLHQGRWIPFAGESRGRSREGTRFTGRGGLKAGLRLRVEGRAGSHGRLRGCAKPRPACRNLGVICRACQVANAHRSGCGAPMMAARGRRDTRSPRMTDGAG